MTIPRVLSIAGSDSGGGAGIQADIKTITMLGGHAMTAITAITAQNTRGVIEIMPVPSDMVLAQIDAVASDIGLDAVKIGMIGSLETLQAVASRLKLAPLGKEGSGRAYDVVFDPVMIATSGTALADEAAIEAFDELLAVATLITPNAPELAALTGLPVGNEVRLEAAAQALAERHGVAVLAKGGHLPGEELIDLLALPDGTIRRWTGKRIETRHSHGTGCTLSSAIAVGLGAGLSLEAAITRARAFVRAALEAAPGLGEGHGPMGHGLGRAHFLF